MANKTPIPQGVIQRILDGARDLFTGPNAADPTAQQEAFLEGPMAPGAPMQPVLHQNDGEQLDVRRWDFPVGINYTTRPRMESTRTRPHVFTADELRLFSRSYGLLRIAIETRKNQILGQEWQINAREGEVVADKDPRLLAARQLFRKPDGRRPFQEWQKVLLEDLLVLDMVSMRVDTAIDGTNAKFRNFDSGTLKLIVDKDGETPIAPLPAYTQVISGLPAGWWDTTQMIVRIYNPANDWLYGYSPVEQIADIVSLGIRRQLHQLNYYTEGNLPESIIVGPQDWDQKQVAKFQVYWDRLYEGPNALKLRRKTRFLPNGATLLQAKDAILKDEMDDWLARQICFAFNISPSALTKDNNRAVGETIQEQNKREGLLPMMTWLKSLYDDMLERAGYPDLEFCWIDEESVSPLNRAQIDNIYFGMGAKTINEVRAGIGLDAVEGGDELGGLAPEPTMGDPAMPGGAPSGGFGAASTEAGFMSMFGVGKRGYGSPIHHHHAHGEHILKRRKAVKKKSQ